VNYRVILRDKASGGVREILETHRMRYLFLPEVQHLLTSGGFELLGAEEWMTAAPLCLTSWNAVFICRKTGSQEIVCAQDATIG
jgi:hypothetical protein